MLRSFNRAVFSTSICLLFILTDRVSADDCNPGFSSPGWMFPKEDVNVEMDQNVTMLCGINTTHPNGKDYSWKNLSFKIDNETAASPWMVEKVNETTIRLFLNQTSLVPHDYHRVSCTLNDMGVCLRFVYIGYKPLEVTDFECTSYNWQRLECHWKEPPNPIKTTYTLSYQTPNSR